jgi:sec-independent protein translocase protein TatA
MLLFLNDIAGSEVLVILVFILIFFGSKSIPGIAKTFGKTMYEIKQASSDLQDEIKKSGLDIKKDLNLTSIIQETVEEVQRPLDQQMVEMDDIITYNPPKKEIPISENQEELTTSEIIETKSITEINDSEVVISSPEASQNEHKTIL